MHKGVLAQGFNLGMPITSALSTLEHWTHTSSGVPVREDVLAQGFNLGISITSGFPRLKRWANAPLRGTSLQR